MVATATACRALAGTSLPLVLAFIGCSARRPAQGARRGGGGTPPTEEEAKPGMPDATEASEDSRQGRGAAPRTPQIDPRLLRSAKLFEDIHLNDPTVKLAQARLERAEAELALGIATGQVEGRFAAVQEQRIHHLEEQQHLAEKVLGLLQGVAGRGGGMKKVMGGFSKEYSKAIEKIGEIMGKGTGAKAKGLFAEFTAAAAAGNEKEAARIAKELAKAHGDLASAIENEQKRLREAIVWSEILRKPLSLRNE